MNIFRRLQKLPDISDPTAPVIVVIEGGMGAQILQSSCYFFLKMSGRQVYADLSYFDREANIAAAGNKGKVSHWHWQMAQYRLTPESFERCPDEATRARCAILRDSPELGSLAMHALSLPEVRRFYQPVDPAHFDLPPVVNERFLCIHVRRGDYVNVASHLVSDDEFVGIARNFSHLLDHAVLLSDSPFEPALKERIEPMFKSVTWLDHLDPYASHWLMRQARVLVCSNSTYSLTAARLNTTGMVVMPKQWYGPEQQAFEEPIQKLCAFQIMT